MTAGRTMAKKSRLLTVTGRSRKTLGSGSLRRFLESPERQTSTVALHGTYRRERIAAMHGRSFQDEM
jgi:hypothetical protein